MNKEIAASIGTGMALFSSRDWSGTWMPMLPVQCVSSSRRWLLGMSWRHPLSTGASSSGNQTVSMLVSSASGMTTPWSWCQGVALMIGL